MLFGQLLIAPKRFVPRFVLGICRVQAGKGSTRLNFTDNPCLKFLLLDSRFYNFIHQCSRNDHSPIVIDDIYVFWKYGNAATTDWFLPVDEGETSNRGRSGRASTPYGKSGAKYSGEIPYYPIRNQSDDTAHFHARTQDVTENSCIRYAHSIHDGDTT